MFDVAGIDQPGVQAVRLEQVEHRLPVVAGCFHHHPLNTKIDQMIGQLGQRPGHRRMGGHLLQSFLGLRPGGDPYAAHHLRLADIQGRDSGDDLFFIVGFGQHRVLLTGSQPPPMGWSPSGNHQGKAESNPRAR
jgi:hypothetical protein